MAKFSKKPVVIEAITFDELVEYGRANSDTLHDEMPWSFDYQGQPITHENDNCYLVPTLEGTMKFNRGEMLITGDNGEIYPCKMDIFRKTYVLIDETKPDMPEVFWSTPEEYLGKASRHKFIGMEADRATSEIENNCVDYRGVIDWVRVRGLIRDRLYAAYVDTCHAHGLVPQALGPELDEKLQRTTGPDAAPTVAVITCPKCGKDHTERGQMAAEIICSCGFVIIRRS